MGRVEMVTRPPSLREMIERLRLMIENGEHVTDFTSSRSREDLDTDVMFQFALIKAVENVGHEAWELHKRFAVYLPEGIPWQEIAKMRHVLAHHYEDVDNDILWRVATADVPEGLPAWRSLLDELETIEGEESGGQDES